MPSFAEYTVWEVKVSAKYEDEARPTVTTYNVAADELLTATGDALMLAREDYGHETPSFEVISAVRTNTIFVRE